jgi:alkylhydroperoxidase/carboxymuconolactone decarboxylase family protein YurZ
MAFDDGVTQDELVEFLNIAMMEGGCPEEQWALKAFEVFKDLRQGKHVEGDRCCRLEDYERT